MTHFSRSRFWIRPSQPAQKDKRRGKYCKPGLEILENRIAPAQVNWTGPATGGDWNTANFWSTSNVPGPSDTASIGANNTVTFSSSDTSRVAALTVDGTLNVTGGNLTIGGTAGSNFTLTTGGTLSGAGSINVSNGAANTWSGGTMTGTGTTTFASGSTLTFSGSTDVLAGGRTLGGAGAATLAGALNLGSGGGTLTFSAMQWTSAGGIDLQGNTLTNAGTITLTSSSTVGLYANNFFSGGGSFNLGGTLSNSGTIVQQGTGSVEMFDNVILSNQGTYQFAADSSILFGNAPPNSFVNTASGLVEKTAGAGTSSIAVPFDNQGGTVDAESGTLQATRGGTSTGGTYTANGSGVVDLTGGSNPTFTGTYTGSGSGRVQLASGTLTIGSGGATFNFTTNGLFVFFGGTLTGALTNANTGFLTVTGGTLSGTLNNQGTITQTGGPLTLNGGLSNAGTYNVALTATGNVTAGGGTFTNTSTGILELSTNVSATLASPFANQGGMVETTAGVTAGTLVLGGGGTSTGGTYDAVAAGGAIDLAGGATSVFSGTYSGSGAGTIELSQGGSIAAGTSGATLAFTTESFQVSNGAFNLQGHTLTNTGTITLTSSSTIGLYANNFFAGGNSFNLGGTLTNTGTIVQQGTGSVEMFDNVVLSNQGTYRFAADSNILFGNAPPNSFVNTGTVTKTTTTGTSSIGVPFDNQGGTVDAESGTLQATRGGTSTGGTLIANGSGVLDLTGGSSPTFTGTYTGSGSGRVQLASGTLTIGSGGATFDFTTNGLFVFSGGTLAGPGTLTNSGTGFLTVTGGTLNGTLSNQGTITQPSGTLTLNGGLSNAGTYAVALAASGNVTTAAGTFTNASTGILELTTNVSATLRSPFANQGGTVETTAAVTTGTLILGGGGTSTGGSYDATAAGAAIDLAGGATSVFNGTYSGSGAGLIELSLTGSIAAGASGATLAFTTESFQVSNGGFNLQGNTLTNTGTITLANPSGTTVALYANQFYIGGTFNLGGTFINTGTVVEGIGPVEMFDNVTLNNQGSYQFTSDSGLIFGNAPPQAVVNSGTIEKSGGTGTTKIDIPFDNQGGTVDAETGTLSLSRGGTSTGGTYTANGTAVIDLTGGSSHTFTGTYTGSGTGRVQITSGSLTIGSGGATFNFPSGQFVWSGGTLSGTLTNAGTGFLTFSSVTPGGTLNNLGAISQTGGTLNVTNSGTFTVSSGTVNLNGGTGGTIAETSSTVNVTGSFAGATMLSGTGGTYNFSGTLTNSGNLSLIGGTTSPTFFLVGATINGGTLTTTSGAQLTATQQGGTLNGVTLAGTVFTGLIINTFVDIKGGLTLAPTGLFRMEGNGELDFLGSQSLTGSGAVDFADNLVIANGFNPSGLKGLYVPNPGDTLTITSGVTVHGLTGFVGSSGGGLVTNNGAIAADGGGTITVQNDTNFAGGTLTGGTWQVSGTSTLDLVGASISTNAANILLDGPSSHLTQNSAGAGALTNLAANAAGGSFTLRNGATFTTAQGFTNAGTLNVGAGSQFNLGLGGGTSSAIPGAISWWQGEGNAADTQGNNPGTLVGGVSFAPGVFGQAFNFNGSDYVNAGTSSSLAPATITVSFWMFARSVNGNFTHPAARWGHSTTSPNSWIFDLAPNLSMNFTVQNTAGTQANAGSSALVSLNAWHFIAGTYDGSTVKVYVDGQLSGQASLTGPLNNNVSTTSIGAKFADGASFFALNGLVDDLQVSSQVLTAGQLAAIFTAAHAQTYAQTGGSTVLSGGTLAGAVQLQAGTLTGSGTIGGNLVNAAAVDLGSAPGTLTVNGNYTQTAAGALSLKVGGTTAGSQFDQVNISGTATLNGALNAALVNGFAPSVGESFTALNFASSSGTFATFNPPLIDGQPAFVTSSTPTSLNLVGATTPPDLAVSAITLPAQGTTGQDVTVSYTVTDLSIGPVAAATTWTDSVYLSAEPTLSTDAVLLGRVPQSGPVAGLSSYTGTLTRPVPGLLDGRYYVIVVIDSGLQVADVNRANNTGASTTTFPVSAPVLALGTPVTGTVAAGQQLYYRLNLGSGTDVQITATSQTVGEANFLVRYAAIPDGSHFDEGAINPATATSEITLAQPQGGDYYLLIQGQAAAGGGQSFTLSASAIPFAVAGVSPNQGSNSGQATLTVTGSEFTPQTVVRLHGPGGTVTAVAVQFQNDTTVFATFNLTGLTPGIYDVQATDHNNVTVTDAGAFTVVSGNPGQLQTNISTAAFIRPNQPGTTVTISYANVGATDIPAPLLTVQASNAVLGYADQSGFLGSSIQVLGIDQNGPAGILPPGYHGTITLNFQPINQAAHASFFFNLLLPAAPSTPIDWNSLEAGSQPSYIGSAAWNAIWNNFTSAAGSTVGQYQAYLDSLATYFSEIGTPTSDVNTLFGYAIELANASLPVSAAIANVDDELPTQGKQLDFLRTYQAGVAEHYQMGPLGRGWVDDWQISATTDSQGNVTLDEDGVLVYFARQANGSYLAGPGNTYTLTNVGGAYQALGVDGTVIAFNQDGTLHFLEDANQNRVTAGYTSGQLTSLTDSNGSFLTLAYNAQGLISTVTDSNGLVTTYTYDPTNELLLSVSNAEQTQHYTYLTGSNPALQFALATLTKTDGTQLFLTYDAQGRLINQQGCTCLSNPVEHLSYTYGIGGTVTTTDNTGDSTTLLFNAYGEPTVEQDALGQITHNYDDANGHLTRTVEPDGTVYTFTYDSRGNLLGETDPRGDTVTLTYDARNNLTGYTDPNGNTTRYGYDGTNNLLSVTYANGAAEQYTYNPLGEATQFINANGQASTYTYNAGGELTQKMFADGTSNSYTYDQFGNVTSATDSLGNVTRLVYGGAADGDPNDPALLSEVMHPDGTFLQFFYNSGGQRVQSVDQTGFTVNYSYDEAGRLSELTDKNGQLIVQYTYDSDDRLKQRDNGNGTRTVYTSDAAGHVLAITNYAPDHVTVNSFDDYTYDALGNVLTDTNQDGTWRYTYDAVDQLTQAVFTPNTTNPDGLASQNIQYVYDAAGNRISQTVNGVATTYTVNNLNEYTSSTTSGVTTSYQYDADGNLTVQSTSSGSTQYTYNVINQLTGVSAPGLAVNAAYDPFGNLIAQTVNGATTRFQVDPTRLNNVVAAFNGSGALTAHFTFGLGLTSQVGASGAAAYYDFNNIGSTVGITGATGQYVNQYAYLPSGQTSTLNAGLPNGFAFLGEWGVMSEPDGLDFMHARYEVPSLGRFLNLDPIGINGGVNLFTYAANNPLNSIDPWGLDPPAPGWLDKILQCPIKPFISVPFPSPPPPGFPGPPPPGAPWPNPSNSGPAGPGDPSPPPPPQGPIFPIIPPGTPAPSAFGFTFTGHFDGPPDGPCGGPPGPPGPPAPPAPPPGPPPGPGGGGAGGGVATPNDPNDIVGPAGFGANGFIAVGQTLPYRIDFENKANATAPAQVVEVTQQLDANLDWSTFQLGAFSFSGQTFAVPAGLTSYTTMIDARSTAGVYVEVNAQFDEKTGLLTWTFTSLDPTTFDVPVGKVLEGFLPPDVTPPQGEAWVSYTIDPKVSDSTGTVLNAQATVIFNAGLSDQSSLATASIVNTIDAAPPTSSVTKLPAFSPGSFTLSWSGSDDLGGSGIAAFTVFVSDNGGAFTPLVTSTAQTSTTFTGLNGHTYGFYSVATDQVGNVQAPPSAAQATTKVDTIAPTSSVAALPPSSPASFTVSWSGQDNPGGSGIAGFDVFVSDNGGPFTLFLQNTTQTSATFTGQPGHRYGFYSVATDRAGNRQATPTAAQASTVVVQPVITAVGRTFTATAGAPFGGPVASFTDPGAQASDFTALISWGDGHTSAGTVTPNGPGFDVAGANTYAAPGSYLVQVVIRRSDGRTATAVSRATVADSHVGIQPGQTATAAFWAGAQGQALINRFPGGPASTALAAWLAANFPNLFGTSAGSHNLTGANNAQVAGFFQALYALPAPRLEAEALATALNVYATTASLGGMAGTAYGFTVSAQGLGAADFDVGVSGPAVAQFNHTSHSVFLLLKQVNFRAQGGVIWSGNAFLRDLTLVLFAGINRPAT
jgi:RHS repeat-associated protein